MVKLLGKRMEKGIDLPASHVFSEVPVPTGARSEGLLVRKVCR